MSKILEEKFHSFCEGCVFIEVKQIERPLMVVIDLPFVNDPPTITCKNYELCNYIRKHILGENNEKEDIFKNAKEKDPISGKPIALCNCSGLPRGE